jgi:hypothetical protein
MVTHVPGDPARAFDRARVREKFLRFARPALAAEEAEHVLARCDAALLRGAFTPLVGEIERVCGDALAPSGSR